MVGAPPFWPTTPRNRRSASSLPPPKLHERDATEPNIRPNVYLADALLNESSRFVRGKPEQTVAWPKHGGVS